MMKIFSVLSTIHVKNGLRQVPKLEEPVFVGHSAIGKALSRMKEHAESEGCVNAS